MNQPNTKALQSQLNRYRYLANCIATAAPQLVQDDVSRLEDILNARIQCLEIGKHSEVSLSKTGETAKAIS